MLSGCLYLVCFLSFKMKLCLYTIILTRVGFVFLQETENAVDLNELCGGYKEVRAQFYVENEFSKITLRPREFILIRNYGLSIRNFFDTDVEDIVSPRLLGGFQFHTFDVTMKNIYGEIERFNYTLSYHKEKPQSGSMTFSIKHYAFRLTCKVWKDKHCFGKCSDIGAISNGVFNARYTYDSVNAFSGLAKEDDDVNLGFQSAVVYKINKHIGGIVLEKINQNYDNFSNLSQLEISKSSNQTNSDPKTFDTCNNNLTDYKQSENKLFCNDISHGYSLNSDSSSSSSSKSELENKNIINISNSNSYMSNNVRPYGEIYKDENSNIGVGKQAPVGRDTLNSDTTTEFLFTEEKDDRYKPSNGLIKVNRKNSELSQDGPPNFVLPNNQDSVKYSETSDKSISDIRLSEGEVTNDFLRNDKSLIDDVIFFGNPLEGRDTNIYTSKDEQPTGNLAYDHPSNELQPNNLVDSDVLKLQESNGNTLNNPFSNNIQSDQTHFDKIDENKLDIKQLASLQADQSSGVQRANKKNPNPINFVLLNNINKISDGVLLNKNLSNSQKSDIIKLTLALSRDNTIQTEKLDTESLSKSNFLNINSGNRHDNDQSDFYLSKSHIPNHSVLNDYKTYSQNSTGKMSNADLLNIIALYKHMSNGDQHNSQQSNGYMPIFDFLNDYKIKSENPNDYLTNSHPLNDYTFLPNGNHQTPYLSNDYRTLIDLLNQYMGNIENSNIKSNGNLPYTHSLHENTLLSNSYLRKPSPSNYVKLILELLNYHKIYSNNPNEGISNTDLFNTHTINNHLKRSYQRKHNPLNKQISILDILTDYKINLGNSNIDKSKANLPNNILPLYEDTILPNSYAPQSYQSNNQKSILDLLNEFKIDTGNSNANKLNANLPIHPIRDNRLLPNGYQRKHYTSNDQKTILDLLNHPKMYSKNSNADLSNTYSLYDNTHLPNIYQ